MPSFLTSLLEPRSIAVIGASRTVGTVGWQIVDNLIRHGFQGAVYPVNPGAKAIHSIPAWRSVREIPGDIDLAIIVVAAEKVINVVEECGRKGVPTVLVISSGFREAGPEGAKREKELVERIRHYGMRLVGPNCMGVLNTDPETSMNATFAPTMPPVGPVSFLSQSGALGVTILDYAAEYGIGIRNFVSVGNRPDVSGNDLLEYWETDPETRVILMYIEDFTNPRRFTRVASRVARKKPIIVVKSGRTSSGTRTTRSHTGALAGADEAADALLAQCGIHRADTVEELFDLAMAFGGLSIPRGNRVAIVTNAGGPGVIIADACAAEGLEVAQLSPETLKGLSEIFATELHSPNPLHLVGTTTADDYHTALDLVLRDPGVDAAIAAFVPPLGAKQQNVAQSIVQAARAHPHTPILAVLMGRDGLPEGRAELQSAGVPAYIFPESAVRALAALSRHGKWLERPVQAATTFPVDSERVADLIKGVAGAGRTELMEHEAYAILDAYGIPTVPYRVVVSADEAAAAAEELGYPVVLKTLSPNIVRRSEIGGLLVELRDPEEVRSGYERLRGNLERSHPEAEVAGFLVAPYLSTGRELIVGMTSDPTFGSVLMFGLGGIYVETFKDVAFRICPVTEREAREMIESIRGFPLLAGLRGGEPVRIESVVEVLQRISQLVQEHPEIREIDVNPLRGAVDGVMAMDAWIGIAPTSAQV